tara:strand:- start:48355 stop:48537 length:183 start_codon:yes stop_codon:yes gene_type:complete
LTLRQGVKADQLIVLQRFHRLHTGIHLQSDLITDRKRGNGRRIEGDDRIIIDDHHITAQI